MSSLANLQVFYNIMYLITLLCLQCNNTSVIKTRKHKKYKQKISTKIRKENLTSVKIAKKKEIYYICVSLSIDS